MAKSAGRAKGCPRTPKLCHERNGLPQQVHRHSDKSSGTIFASAAMAGGKLRALLETCQDDRETLAAATQKMTHTITQQSLATQSGRLGMAVAVFQAQRKIRRWIRWPAMGVGVVGCHTRLVRDEPIIPARLARWPLRRKERE